MNKYFFAPQQQNEDMVSFTGNTAHHMHHVLRMRVGTEVLLCDGKSMDYTVRLETIVEKPLCLTFRLIESMPCMTEASIPITLFQSLPKGEKMEWIIEKAIELGVNKIVPVITSRTVVKIKDSAKKIERYAKIAEAAASQSMRGIVPVVTPPVSIAIAISEVNSASNNELNLVAHEKEHTRTIKAVLAQTTPRPVSVWVGPEGGFDNNEITTLENVGAQAITLGPRILRTETAGLVAITQTLCIWDE